MECNKFKTFFVILVFSFNRNLFVESGKGNVFIETIFFSHTSTYYFMILTYYYYDSDYHNNLISIKLTFYCAC